MSNLYYKGYRIGSLEKEILKLILGVTNSETPNRRNISFADILKISKQKNSYSRSTKNLVQKGLLSFENRGGEIVIKITDKGRQTANKLFLGEIDIKKKRTTWDGKWRMVIFDIPEKKRKTRDLIRFHLKRLGFLQIQGSVWIYPYPCEEIVTIIKSNFNLNDEIVYLTANPFEKDFIFRKRFKI
jgi:hypothetical protein